MAKYDSITKRDRNNAVIEMRRNHPELSLAEIGKVFGITTSMVFKIIDRDRKRHAYVP